MAQKEQQQHSLANLFTITVLVLIGMVFVVAVFSGVLALLRGSVPNGDEAIQWALLLGISFAIALNFWKQL